MAINNVIISGNLAADPAKRGNADNPVLNFSVAVNERVKNGDTWEDRPSFVDCVLFGNRAKGLSGVLKKGMKVAVSGKLNQSRWEQDGQKRSKLEVIAQEVDIMSAHVAEGKEEAKASVSW